MNLGPDPAALSALAGSGGKNSADAVATGFESMFASLVLKEMRQTLDSGTMFAGDTGDVYGGLFDMYMGQHIAATGGLGIAAAVRRQLDKTTNPTAKVRGYHAS
jgi:Rod binding domain-containing protein